MQTVYRVCQSPPAGANTGPIGVPAAWLATDFEPRMTVWVTDRRGNPDICYSYAGDGYDGLIDSNPALDSSPALTMQTALMWCFWQSNRSGNWDIYGSFIYETGVGEKRPQSPNGGLEISPNPSRGTVRFQLTASSPQPEIRIFDQSGRLVRTLVSRPTPHATVDLTWDCRDQTGVCVPAGCYFAAVKSGNRMLQRKVVVSE